jgi:dienelactone hydrolase
MAEVVLYHHIQGLTDGVRSFADELRRAGHTVHTPDLFDGRTFATMDEAFAVVQEAGDAFDAKADGAAHALPEGLVYAGISWGVGAAQRLAQTRAGARGALLYEACFPITGEYAFGPWPNDLPVQIHGKGDDEFFAHEGDIDAARDLVAKIGPEKAELFVYPGDEHLFVDSSLPTYDGDAAALVTQRTLHFLSVL